jgi:proteasome lid subunit RPN8/RPN11
MSEEKKLDVSRLAKSNFPEEAFPAKMDRDFRVAFDDQVYERILDHADKDKSVEIGGILVGDWKRDDEGPYVHISAVIPCDKATSKTGEVTFTHETWGEVSEEMDSTYEDLRIIGWYHSHPGFGIFLSDRDMFIQNHFFNDPGQIALVVDPVAQTEGVFVWRKGDAHLEEMFWIGDNIRTSPPVGATFGKNVGPADPIAEQAAEEELKLPAFSGFALAFMGILLLVIGWSIGDKKSEWEQRMLTEGAIARYGDDKSIQIGLELGTDLHDMNEMIVGLQQAGRGLIEKAETSEQDEEASEKDDPEESPEEDFARYLLGLHNKVLEVHGKYCFTQEEIAAIRRVQAAREAAAAAAEEKEGEKENKTDDPDDPDSEPSDEQPDTPTTPDEPVETLDDDASTISDDTSEDAVAEVEDASTADETPADDATEEIPENDATDTETTTDDDAVEESENE